MKPDPMALVRYEQKAVFDLFQVEITGVERVFFSMDVPSTSSIVGGVYSAVTIGLIVLSCAIFLIASHPDYQFVSEACKEMRATMDTPRKDYQCLAICEPYPGPYLE